MDWTKKPVLKWAGMYCLLLVCLFTMFFPVRAAAAPAANPVMLTLAQTFNQPAGCTAADTFTYKLTAKEPGNPMPAGSLGDVHTFTASGTCSKDIGAISFTQSGIYNYEITHHVTGSNTGYTYDNQVYTVTVYIKSSLEADIIINNKDGGKVDVIEYAHAYTPKPSDPSLMVDPPVRKTVSGSPSANGTFTFKLEARDSSFPMPAGSTNGVKWMTIVGPGEKDFGTWSYTQPGTYFYTVSEVNNGEAGYTYDTMVYTITDRVEDMDGQLILTRTITNSSNKQVESYDFINKYKANDGGGSPGGNPAGGPANGPKTGDDSLLEVYRAALCISSTLFLVCVALLLLGRKRKKASDG